MQKAPFILPIFCGGYSINILTFKGFQQRKTLNQQSQNSVSVYSQLLCVLCCRSERTSDNGPGWKYRSSCPKAFLEEGDLKICSKFYENAHAEGYSLVNLLHIFRTLFPKNTHGWLLIHRRSTSSDILTFSVLCKFIMSL